MRLADNHTGWEVQSRDNLGWFKVAGPFPIREMAEKAMRRFMDEDGGEYRVYEAVE